MNSLQTCLEDNKFWMALNFLYFNYSKTELMVFGLGSVGVPSVDLKTWKSFCKPEIVNFDFKIDPESLKLQSQIPSVVRSSFFYLRLPHVFYLAHQPSFIFSSLAACAF